MKNNRKKPVRLVFVFTELKRKSSLIDFLGLKILDTNMFEIIEILII